MVIGYISIEFHHFVDFSIIFNHFTTRVTLKFIIFFNNDTKFGFENVCENRIVLCHYVITMDFHQVYAESFANLSFYFA